MAAFWLRTRSNANGCSTMLGWMRECGDKQREHSVRPYTQCVTSAPRTRETATGTFRLRLEPKELQTSRWASGSEPHS